MNWRHEISVNKIAILIVLLLTASCHKTKLSFPVIITGQITDINQTTAISGGSIPSDGGSMVTTRGVCWSANHIPSTSDYKTMEGSGIGNFSSTISGLTNNMRYIVRAYATNSVGTAYGDTLSFTAGTIIDFDKNVYRSVKIGRQVWMEENLKSTHYQNGEAIPNIQDNILWWNMTSGAYCNHLTDSMTSVYGKLYNWFVVNDIKNICPQGWRVANDSDFSTLISYLGGEYVAGGKMKATGTQYWEWNVGGTNESGFSGLPGGMRYENGYYTLYGNHGYWWSNTMDSDTTYAHCLNVRSVDPYARMGGNKKPVGCSVRCIKNE